MTKETDRKEKSGNQQDSSMCSNRKMMELGIFHQIHKGDDQLAGNVKMTSLEGHFPDKSSEPFYIGVMGKLGEGGASLGVVHDTDYSSKVRDLSPMPL
ncbi:hypothetical protein TNCV_153671 [Trichonephila clavipes]|nr:hypothetical protein TNCV_153671 [Trichonephila clavipes]